MCLLAKNEYNTLQYSTKLLIKRKTKITIKDLIKEFLTLSIVEFEFEKINVVSLIMLNYAHHLFKKTIQQPAEMENKK